MELRSNNHTGKIVPEVAAVVAVRDIVARAIVANEATTAEVVAVVMANRTISMTETGTDRTRHLEVLICPPLVKVVVVVIMADMEHKIDSRA